MSHSGPKEEILGLLPLKGQTCGEDIANAVIECIDKHYTPLDKIVLISTDGTKSMTVFVAILKEKINHEILFYHCIIHQEALCAQTFPDEICKVLELALNHRQFKEFLFEMESEYVHLLLHNKLLYEAGIMALKRALCDLKELRFHWLYGFFSPNEITTKHDFGYRNKIPKYSRHSVLCAMVVSTAFWFHETYFVINHPDAVLGHEQAKVERWTDEQLGIPSD